MDEELREGSGAVVPRAPGGDARLRHAGRSMVRGLPRVSEAEPRDPAHVLAKAARRTGAWLKLDAAVFEAAIGLALHGDSVPPPGSAPWDRALELVLLGGRLERKLGRRGTVLAWLRAPHLQLRPTPLDILGTVDGVQALHEYLDRFER